MNRLHRLTLVLIVIALFALVSVTATEAANAISNVALSSYSTCLGAGVDLSINMDGTATREAGAAFVNGSMFYSFEHSTSLGSFNGTYNGYNYPYPDQPPNSIITLTGYVGSTPQNTNTVE